MGWYIQSGMVWGCSLACFLTSVEQCMWWTFLGQDWWWPKCTKHLCISFPLAGCSAEWEIRVQRRKLSESRALSITEGSGLCKPLSHHQDWRTQQMAPHFIPEGARSGICRDSALRGTGQAISMERACYPHGGWLFITISCSLWVFLCSFRVELCFSMYFPPLCISLLIWLGRTSCI